jgi:Mn-dependent DtxR family transcriptional regulator
MTLSLGKRGPCRSQRVGEALDIHNQLLRLAYTLAPAGYVIAARQRGAVMTPRGTHG